MYTNVHLEWGSSVVVVAAMKNLCVALKKVFVLDNSHIVKYDMFAFGVSL